MVILTGTPTLIVSNLAYTKGSTKAISFLFSCADVSASIIVGRVGIFS